MENQESQKRESGLDEMRDIISHASDRVEKEFARTANSWLACFGSSVFVVGTCLSNIERAALLSHEQYQRALQRLEELKKRLYQLQEQYPEKETMPPDDVREELLRKLDILREGE